MSPGAEARVFRLLLVEDNEADVYLIRLALKEAGLNCELTVIPDGAAALSFLLNPENHEGARPDLVLLDLNVPRKSGTELLEALRSNSDLAHLPVAVMTSSSSPLDEEKIERLGVERFFTKGTNLEDFLKIGAELKEIILSLLP